MIEQRIEPIVRDWLPQRFGSGKARRIVDPIIEPLWIGERVLAGVRGVDGRPTVTLLGADGRTLDIDRDGGAELDAVVSAIPAAMAGRATSAVIDGYLTRQATRPPAGHVTEVEAPTLADHTTRLVIGERRGRREEAAQDAAAHAAVARGGSPLAFVAVDLLEIDGTELLDVPLLERKRLLESVIAPDELVRIGPYVRPPLDSWLGTWRVAGFVDIAFKAANSRYRPGAANDDWATMRIPRP